jgi:phage shock protein A
MWRAATCMKNRETCTIAIMSDLFRKLNTLVKARLNDSLGDVSEGVRRLGRSDKVVHREIGKLRERINDAIEYEQTLQSKAQELQREVERLDIEADEAVKQGKDAQARYIIAQMQRTQQRTTIAEADLRAHRLVTEDLVRRVNLLEQAVVNTASQNQAEGGEEHTVNSRMGKSIDALNTMIKETHDRITGTLINPKSGENPLETLSNQDTLDTNAVEDDLDERRNRLSMR